MTFWYTNNELSETETKKEIPFIIATKIIKCLGITSTRKVKELYSIQKKKKKTIKHCSNKLRNMEINGGISMFMNWRNLHH